jgi:hypothetical protein
MRQIAAQPKTLPSDKESLFMLADAVETLQARNLEAEVGHDSCTFFLKKRNSECF